MALCQWIEWLDREIHEYYYYYCAMRCYSSLVPLISIPIDPVFYVLENDGARNENQEMRTLSPRSNLNDARYQMLYFYSLTVH